jgi:hypothetical protein
MHETAFKTEIILVTRRDSRGSGGEGAMAKRKMMKRMALEMSMILGLVFTIQDWGNG